jgi:lysophosphatidic acid acyltransferase/lysophosphatidylinositol acyltransferase
MSRVGAVLEGLFKRSFPVQFIFLYIFLGSGFIVNFLQLLSCVVWPFSKSLYRRVNRFLAYIFWSNITWSAQHWANCTCDLYLDPANLDYVNKEHVICIMNHKYDIDWLMGWIICQRTGLLAVNKKITV